MVFLRKRFTNGMSDAMLASYVAGETSADENVTIKKWVDKSEENKKYVDGLSLIMENSKLELKPSPAESVAWEAFSDKILQQGLKKTAIPLRYKWAAAASVVFLIAGTILILIGKNTTTRSVAAINREIIGDGCRADILPDGSIIRLDKNSILYCPVNFDSKQRSVKLTGNGYFSVVHRGQQPFRISVNDILVTDIGTSFYIRSDSLNTYVSVETGVVEIARRNKLLRLVKGEELHVTASDTALIKNIINAATSVKQKPAMHPSDKKTSSQSLQDNPGKQKKAMRSIILDITNMHLAENKDSIRWFGLTSDEFIINGQKQSKIIEQKFIKKYHVKPDNGFFYGPVKMTGNGFFISKKELEE